MAEYRKNHYVPRGMLFNFTGEGEVDFYFLNKNGKKVNFVKKLIRNKDDFKNIGEINDLYKLKSGRTLEPMMSDGENKFIYPFLNRCKCFICSPRNLLLDDNFVMELSFYIRFMEWRNADRIGFYKQFNKLRKFGVHIPEYNAADWMLFDFHNDVENDMGTIKLIYRYIKSSSCYIHIVQSNQFCFKSNLIVFANNNFFTWFKGLTPREALAKMYSNPEQFHNEIMHPTGFMSPNHLLIVPITKNIILEFKKEPIRRLVYCNENEESLWFNLYIFWTITTTTEFLFTSSDFHSLIFTNKKIKHHILFSLQNGKKWREGL